VTLTALRVRPVPVVEPRPAVRVVPDDVDDAGGPGRPVQEALPLDVPDLAGPGPAAALGAASVTLTASAGHACGPRGWAVQFTQAALEVVAGLRPPTQLLRWTTEEVQVALQRRHALALRAGERPRRLRVRSVHVSTPVDGVAEVAAIVGDGVRYRAFAFRMEGYDERWRVTAIDLG
jgi:Family of unknown function (DUF6459)